jgi:hypothetical protein|uniref:hypothetical protein n=1 Tax=Candidatus Limnocylindrus sp. TaxID=2802978 RepID=UPI0040492B80
MTLRDGDRRSAAEQLELPMDEQPTAPFAGKVLRTTATPPTPPRIPTGDQRLIRLLAIGALVAGLLTAGGALTIDPLDEPTRALAVAGTLGLTVALGLTSLLLLRSFRGHPGVWRVRRRRSLRRGLLAGALIGGYLALRIIGLGGPTGLLIATLLVVVAEAAISRSEIDSV